MATVLGKITVGTRHDDILGSDAPGDFIVGGPGNDFLLGSTGADVFGFNPGDGQDFVSNFTPGVDKVQFGGGLTSASLHIQPETIAGVAGLAIYYAGIGGPDAVFLAGVSALQPTDVVFEALPAAIREPVA